MVLKSELTHKVIYVSYTHLDVYKRQAKRLHNIYRLKDSTKGSAKTRPNQHKFVVNQLANYYVTVNL